MRRIYIQTYGCQMNEYDTEILKSILGSGFLFTTDPGEADIVLLNTCSVRENAERKVFARIYQLKHENPGLRIGILGCMASHFKDKLFEQKSLPVDFVAGPDSYRQLPEMLARSQDSGFDVTLSEFETYENIFPFREKGVNAWIAIMRGCNNFCSFCIVPYTRGRERSRSPQSILQETQQLVRDGFCQVTLLGQNVNSYRYEDTGFPALLKKISRVEGLKRIRFTSPHPKDFPSELLTVIADNPGICKHIHLPLQAGSDRILKKMRRKYTRQQYFDLVGKIRDVCPEMVLTTDIIVGFPTESDTEFWDTVDVVETVQFDSAFIFKYSPREGTAAAKNYPDDIPETVKTERIIQLNGLQKNISLTKNRAHIGETHQVLIEALETKKSKADVQGRNDGNKLVILTNNDYRLGDMLNVRITGATAHVLKGITE
ncbi:tRNA (N6-isopentenyl adenosine(37)-C2)-methylthiotransferase MiaB [candidate division KSB1 bacterium]|nr:tRNA (N6-isopentenyl adenosine(37)-C2)-methylthiotransferase MiaB [candidate division KSB1 bacterium]